MLADPDDLTSQKSTDHDLAWVLKLSSVQRLAEMIRRQMNLRVHIISASDIQWLGVSQTIDTPVCDRNMMMSAGQLCYATYRQWLENIVRNPVTQMDLTCHAGLSGIGVPVRRAGKVLAALFASGFVYSSEQSAHENMNVLSRREAGLVAELLNEISMEIQNRWEQDADYLTVASSDNKKEFRHDFTNIIGHAESMRKVFKLLDSVCDCHSSVMIEGEPGVGKELIARAIHYQGLRKHGPFVVQNCGAMGDELLDSELFGHKRGAFTSALMDKPGLFDIADKGTFFLDEVADMSPRLQVKLLRVLQEGTFLPVGDTIPHTVDVRIVAATNKNLLELVESGKFRRDLYYRLNVISISVPALAERRDDIPELIEYFLEKKCRDNHRALYTLTREAKDILCAYQWPGNVRELENEIERLVVLSGDNPMIGTDNISQRILRSCYIGNHTIHEDEIQTKTIDGMMDELPASGLSDVMDQFERKMIIHVLKKNDGNRSKTAEILGISRRQLIRKLEKYHISEN